MADLLKLIIKAGEDIDKSFDFDKEEILIGRDPSCDMVIDDIEVSRVHLLIRKVKGEYIIEDQNSTNGSALNGKELTAPSKIDNGDLIAIGGQHILELIIEQTADLEVSEEYIEDDPFPDPILSDEASIDDKEAVVSNLEKEESSRRALEPEEKEQKAKGTFLQGKPRWLVILLFALAFVVVFCVLPLIVIEITNQWCNLFAGFFNSLSPGVCL